MIQGWNQDTYLILFEEQLEAITITGRYDLGTYLPGFTIDGLWGWDDFILRNTHDQFFTVPTVPLVAAHLKPFPFETLDWFHLRSDDRVADKIKWYVRPLAFGGDPQAADNLTWLTLDQHIEAVKWWNNTYRNLRATA